MQFLLNYFYYCILKIAIDSEELLIQESLKANKNIVETRNQELKKEVFIINQIRKIETTNIKFFSSEFSFI